jgi:hypothetical protein
MILGRGNGGEGRGNFNGKCLFEMELFMTIRTKISFLFGLYFFINSKNT